MADLANIPVRASFDWPSISATPRDRWVVGIDLGKSNDSTAIAVVHHTIVALDSWTPNPTAKHWKQDRVQRFDLLHLQRLPLGLSYVAQVAAIREILDREPLSNCKPDTVWDQSGVGAAVVDIAKNAGIPHMHRIVITSGLECTQVDGNTHHVGKGPLISRLEAAMHTRELHVAAALKESDTLRDELRDFERRTTEAGRTTWAARGSAHDDTILAVACAIWHACNRNVCSIEELRI
jgi:hypothetical protein